jgi:hypothetical protein
MIPHLFTMLMGGSDGISLEAEGGGSPPPPNPLSNTYRKLFLCVG